jgi:tyrosyl-tRNA synthetase
MSKIEIAYNHKWLEPLTFKDILSLTSHFTAQQMLKRDMFVKRMEEEAPISLTEFMYPLMVGYDSVILDVDAEIGGNDQLFNMLAGRTLMKEMKQKEKFVLTTKLIDGTDGRKMSKTYNNCVYLTDEPNDMYGKILSMPDHLIPLYMECCTDFSMADVNTCAEALKTGSENPKNLKMRLASEIVTMYHSSEAAKTAEETFENIFKDKGLPEDMPEYSSKEGESLVDALLASGTVESKSEARRLIEQGGVKVNDVVVSDVNSTVEAGIVKVGKRKFLKMIVE